MDHWRKIGVKIEDGSKLSVSLPSSQYLRSWSQALQRFLRSASETPETAVGFEFMQDNRGWAKLAENTSKELRCRGEKVG
jgi:hypothetical protein